MRMPSLPGRGFGLSPAPPCPPLKGHVSRDCISFGAGGRLPSKAIWAECAWGVDLTFGARRYKALFLKSESLNIMMSYYLGKSAKFIP